MTTTAAGVSIMSSSIRHIEHLIEHYKSARDSATHKIQGPPLKSTDHMVPSSLREPCDRLVTCRW